MNLPATDASRSDEKSGGGSDPASFEQAMAELEALVQGMEGGDFSLEQSLAAYQRGAVLVGFCRQSLLAARQQVRILEGDLLKSFDAAQDDDA